MRCDAHADFYTRIIISQSSVDEGGHSTEEEGGAWGKCIVGLLSSFASLIVNTNVCNGVWCMSVIYRLSITD